MTDQEIQNIADLLKTLKPGFLPYPIFEQLARLVVMPIIEFVPLRAKDQKAEVLLIARPTDDTHWPGLLHTPGTVIRATDEYHEGESQWEPFRRIVDDELQGTKIGKPNYVGSMFHASKRGMEQAQLYWVEVLDEPIVGKFYQIDNLPEGLIESQLAFINEAGRHFKQHHASVNS